MAERVSVPSLVIRAAPLTRQTNPSNQHSILIVPFRHTFHRPHSTAYNRDVLDSIISEVFWFHRISLQKHVVEFSPL